MARSHNLLTDSNFLTLWGVGALNSTGRWLEMLVIGIFVFEVSESPLLVASMLMLRLLPMALFGVFGGVVAHRFERWRILRVASVIIVLLTLALYALAVTGSIAVWHVAAGSFVSGLVWSTDFPVRRTLMGDIAGSSNVGRAMSLDVLAGSSTRMLGPLLGGVLYQQIGLDGAFLLTSVLYLAGLVCLLLTRGRDAPPQQTTDSVTDNLRDGWRALRSSTTLPAILSVTVVFNVWGFPFISMVPVFGKDVLGLDAQAVGLLASAEGAGAFLGALLLSLFVRSEHARALYFGAVVSYCAFALAFSLSTVVWLSATLLLSVGFVSAAFGAMQSALVLMHAPRGFERQMMGVLSVCIGTAPIGFLHMGLLAGWLGAPLACTVVAIEGLAAMAVIARKASRRDTSPDTAHGADHHGHTPPREANTGCPTSPDRPVASGVEPSRGAPASDGTES